MDGGGGCLGGGILSLVDQLVDDPEFLEAVEADLIRLGLRLHQLGDGSGSLSWRDLTVIIKTASTGSAIARHFVGEAAEWGATEYLLAAAIDALNVANWQRGGGKTVHKPDPVPRPVNKLELANANPFEDNSGVFRGESMPIDELNKWLGWVA